MTSDAELPIVWLHGEIRTPPFTREGRIEAGQLLGKLQRGERLSMPHSRPMPVIGPRCHELRIVDGEHKWRVVYRVDKDAVVVLEVFAKTSRATPKHVIENCQRRNALYDEVTRGRR